jgi:hypothetical protein
MKMEDSITDGLDLEQTVEYWDKVFKKLEYEPNQFDRDEAAEERDEHNPEHS